MSRTGLTRHRRGLPMLAGLGAVTLALTGAVAVTAAPAQATEPAPDTDRVPAPPVAWGPCDLDTFPTVGSEGTSVVPPTYDCADYEVPLDYDDPDGERITLALMRRPADDPGAKQGTVFINPGGPGGSGVNVVLGAGESLFGPEVRARFDVVGMDPRGIDRSTPLQCYETTEDFFADRAADEFTNVWPRSVQEWRAERRDVRDNAGDCEREAGPIIDHMGTGNVARDLDVLRRAVGDDQLSFAGYSYGTQICATYANLYPDRVGALVCDANFDPVDYATGEPVWEGLITPGAYRIGSWEGSDATLEEFFRLCDEAGPDRCAFAPDAAGRYAALAASLADEPVALVFPDGGFVEPTPVDDRTLVALSNSAMYDSFGWPSFAALLGELERLAAGGDPVDVDPGDLPASPIVPPVDPPYLNAEGFTGVFCSDKLQPQSFLAWPFAVARADAADGDGYTGPLWAAVDTECADWPAVDRDRYLGPFDAETANPVLIVNTLFDPATPYEDAVAHAERLPNSALLTVEGWGHTALGLSACVDDIVDGYLLTRTVPDGELRCSQDVGPFDSPVAVEATPLASPDATTGDETVPAASAPVAEEAADAALAELARTGDPAAAVAAAEDVTATAVEDAGDADLAERLAVRDALLDEATPPRGAVRVPVTTG